MLLNLVCNGLKLGFFMIFVRILLYFRIGMLLIVVLKDLLVIVFCILVKEWIVMLVDSLLFLMMYLLLGFIFILCGDFGVGRK